MTDAMEVDEYNDHIPEIMILDDILDIHQKDGESSTSSSSRESSTIHFQNPVVLKPKPIAKGFSPIEALQIYKHNLTDYEKDEILSFNRIFFTGTLSKKLQPENPEKGGYDDQKGSYRYILQDHLGYRYEVYNTLGSGSFGQVYKCYDHKRKKHVAVKIVRNTPKVAQSAHIEGEILLHLSTSNSPGSNNIVKLLNFFQFRLHRCLVFELMGLSLYDILKKRNFKGLTSSQVKPIASEVLLALNYLRERKVVHCDLKPENILLDSANFERVKLIDFGSACYEGKSCYTYIQSRFYRAPEVLLNASFGSPIDMWSFGCIIYELVAGYPLFPGENRFDQLNVIMELLGMPPNSLVLRGKASPDYFRLGEPRYCKIKKLSDGTSIYAPDKSPKGNARVLPGTKTWESVLKTRADPKLVYFLKRCLEYEPLKRYAPLTALNDSWLKDPPEIITID